MHHVYAIADGTEHHTFQQTYSSDLFLLNITASNSRQDSQFVVSGGLTSFPYTLQWLQGLTACSLSSAHQCTNNRPTQP